MAREKKPDPPPTQHEQDFEQSMTDLERIVDELESGSLPLDASLAHYEKGMSISKRLAQTLDQAEKRIEKLVEAESAEEPPETEPAAPELRPPGTGSPEGELPF